MLAAGIVVVILAVVIYAGVKFMQSSSPRGFAYHIAKTQLNGYRRIKTNKKYARSSDEKIFKIVLSGRPGYGDKEISLIVKKAKDIASYDDRQPDFRDFVMQLVLFDYERRIGYIANGVTGELASGVFEAIPD